MDWAGSPLSTRDNRRHVHAGCLGDIHQPRRPAPRPARYTADGAPGGPAPGGPAPGGPAPGGPAPGAPHAGGAPPGTPDLAGALRAGPARMDPPPAGIPGVMTNHPAGRASSGNRRRPP
jgi:hypothetical protein